jgi:selenide,water dikinase
MSEITPENVRLTQYSHGAGCGCKISPKVLRKILSHTKTEVIDSKLLVGNSTLDDAAVYEIDEKKVLISTTDFFMPIVDNPLDFGGIAAVNALSDVYAMGGKPLMAVAVLVWPVNTLSEEIAGQVLEGAKRACAEAGIAVAGGHSIDGPEPIFGLAVTGIADKEQIKKNSSATAGCELYLTKPLGVGILSTAQKQGILKDEDLNKSRNSMLTLNKVGQEFGLLEGVTAMTDITGFGLLGHLSEVADGSNLTAHIEMDKIPLIDGLDYYIERETFPGGTFRNYESYGHKISPITDTQKHVLCDPQTSGGLLVAVEPSKRDEFLAVCKNSNLDLQSFGTLEERGDYSVVVK